MKRLSRRTLLTLPPSLLAITGLTGFTDLPQKTNGTPPNILLIMVDQMQTPPEGYLPDQGAAQGLKEILGFRPITPGNPYRSFFPGMIRLRQNAVVLKQHYTASSASVPSRCCIMTGQYSTVTGVDQTDGLFKSAEDVPFLDPTGTPTIGDWFRLAGYSTHYFGKWHVSDPSDPDYLEPWGFDDWESSYPEPHGGKSDNLGVYRDKVFTANIVDFLQKMGTSSTGPWFTVASLVNPHDVSSWPLNWQVPDTLGVVPWTDYPPPIINPLPGDSSLWGTVPTVENGLHITKTFRVALNPDGFPATNNTPPPTFDEILDHKPQCQFDYSYKYGLALGASQDNYFISNGQPYRSPLPFQLNDYYSEWSLGYVNFYLYCQYLADLQLRQILQALDDNGLADNTIVVFISDHGEMSAAHGGMIQKWHNAYEESIRVPCIISSPCINPDPSTLKELQAPTSSIDLAPTLLGLAGIQPETLIGKMEATGTHSPVYNFPGVNLSPYIKGVAQPPVIGSDGKPRTGVLFMSHDMITEKGANYTGPNYDFFLERVDSVIGLGYDLTRGTVRQPNNPIAFCTGDWKIVKYIDPHGALPDQWELYCLTNDPVERINLVDFATGLVRSDVSVPGMTTQQLQAKNEYLKWQLDQAYGMEEGATFRQIMLFQNAPNPFTQSTSLSFYLPETCRIVLTISDFSGRILQTVTEEKLAPGIQHYTFDGSTLPPGIYLIRLQNETQSLVKKMIRMR